MIINTINTKQQQLEQGYFSIGSGKETILIIGSCRSVPYVQYFHDWNDQNGNRFTINFLDPFNWNYDLQNNRVSMEEVITKLETHDGLLTMLKSVDIFIHEYYKNFGMFNTNKEEKSIYDFGLNPKIDICIPSFNDKFILFHDIVAFDPEIRKKAIADYNVIGKLSEQTESEIREISNNNLLKFYEVCEKSDILYFDVNFSDIMVKHRLWHNSNHVSVFFTASIFTRISEKLNIELTNKFIENMYKNDMYANIFTPLSEYDKFNWGETIVPLRDRL